MCKWSALTVAAVAIAIGAGGCVRHLAPDEPKQSNIGRGRRLPRASAQADAGGSAVDGRAAVLDASDDLEKHSLDYYATLRSVAAQHRAALVEDGRAGLVQPETAAVE